jgi:hypothetical protein
VIDNWFNRQIFCYFTLQIDMSCAWVFKLAKYLIGAFFLTICPSVILDYLSFCYSWLFVLLSFLTIYPSVILDYLSFCHSWLFVLSFLTIYPSVILDYLSFCHSWLFVLLSFLTICPSVILDYLSFCYSWLFVLLLFYIQFHITPSFHIMDNLCMVPLQRFQVHLVGETGVKTNFPYLFPLCKVMIIAFKKLY